MILVARIEDMRSAPDGRLLVTSSYWVDASPPVSNSVVAACAIGPADAVRASVVAACVASASADFGIDTSEITSSTVL